MKPRVWVNNQMTFARTTEPDEESLFFEVIEKSYAEELEAKLQYEKDALAAAIEHIENLNSKNKDLEAKLRISVEALDMIGGRNLESWGAMYEDIAEAALKKIRGEK